MACPRLPESMIVCSYNLWKAEEFIRAQDPKAFQYINDLFYGNANMDVAIAAVHNENPDVHCMLEMRGTLASARNARLHINAWRAGKDSDRWNYDMYDLCGDWIADTHAQLKRLLVGEWGYAKPTVRDYAKYGTGGNCC